MRVGLPEKAAAFYRAVQLPEGTTLADLARLALVRLLSGGFAKESVQAVLRGLCEGPAVQHLELDLRTSGYLVEIAEQLEVSSAGALAFVASTRHTLERRLLLERSFAEVEVGADPTWMSDQFLEMWAASRRPNASELDVRLVQQMRPLQQLLGAALLRVERLEALLAHYMSAHKGREVSETLLRTAPLPELLGICALHDVVVPTNLLRYPKMVRAHLLKSFGYRGDP